MGRKIGTGERKTPVQVLFSASCLAELDRRAIAANTSRNDIIRELVQRAIDAEVANG